MKALEIKKLVKIRFNLLNEHFFPPVFFESISVGMFSIFLAVYFLQVHLSNLYIPFSYRGDSYFIILIIKSILDNGWYFHNSYLGAPFGLENYDFPIPDGGMLILIKIIGYFYPNPWFIHNVIYLGSFFIIAAISYAVLYKLSINKILAFSGAILFTFLPFHFLRLPHLFYTWYFTIPIYIFFCIKIMSDENKNKGNTIISLKDALILIFCASFGIYFAFFASILFTFSTIYSFQSNHEHCQLQRSIIFIGIIYMTLTLILSPNILYKILTPPNIEVAVRNPAEAEIHGLRIVQLLLPSPVHRINLFAEKTQKYNKNTPLVSENATATLGLIGSIGFILLLVSIFTRKRTLLDIRIIPQLAILNLACFLVGTIGGLGSLFSLFISPMIRGYNRISVFISFLSITTVMLVLQKTIADRKFKNPNLVYILTIVLVLLIGLFDQTSVAFIPNYAAIKQEYQNDAQFIQKIEASVPEGTMIYQLPYVKYPESPPLYNEGDYGLIRGYLHSKTLKWSYGAMAGSEGDFWLRSMNTLPIEEQVEKITAYGFGGIYLDRRAFKDRAIKLESQLKKLITTDPIISEDNNIVFYHIQLTGNTLYDNSIKDYLKNLKFKYSASDINIGTIVGQRDIEKNTITSTGKGGALQYGPYIYLLSGVYKVKWYIHMQLGIQNEVGRVDIYDSIHNKIIAEQNIKISMADKNNDYYVVELQFSLPQPIKKLEFRFFVQDKIILTLSEIILEKVE